MNICTFCGESADTECQCCGDSRCAKHAGLRTLEGDAAVGCSDETVMACWPVCDPIELSPYLVSEMRQQQIGGGSDACPF